METSKETIRHSEEKFEAYTQAQNEMFKVGDQVEILRKITDKEAESWPNSWVDDMDLLIGQIATIECLTPHGVAFKCPETISKEVGDAFYFDFPYQSLILVSR